PVTKITDSTNVVKNEIRDLETDSTVVDTIITQEKMASYNNLDAQIQMVIDRVDAALDKAYSYKPKNPDRALLLKKTEELIDSAQQVFENPFLFASMGDLKMLQGKNVEAVAQYEQALNKLGNIETIRRNHAGACYNGALELINKNDTDRAITFMEGFYKYAPNDENGEAILLDWYKKRAVGLMRKLQYRKGLTLCKKALAIAPNDHIANFNAGIANFRLNNYDKAIIKFEKCLKINPLDNYSKNYLYIIYTQLGEPDMAKKYETEVINVTVPVK
ncbi:MAG: tetratricopeptide repeat protein, partial [Bacteroidia bacterium]